GFRFAALLGFSIRFLLRLLSRTLADVRAERIETRLLLVVQRIIEILECRPYDLYRVERCAYAVRHRPQATGWRHRIGIGAAEHVGRLCRGSLQFIKHGALIGPRLYCPRDLLDRPGGHALIRSSAQLPEGLRAHACASARAKIGDRSARF